MLTFSDRIVHYLEKFGVDYVFSVPGSPLCSLYDALLRGANKGGTIRSILTRHENGSVFMADGYARETGKIGVCMATTGPGTTNLITGIATAYTDHIPLLLLTAQTALTNFGRGSFQESSADAIDTLGMLQHCTRYNSLVTHPQQLERKLAVALTTALQTPQGPAHLSIPLDILRKDLSETDELLFPQLATLLTESSATINLAKVEKLYQLIIATLQQKQQVVLLIGHDCKGANQELQAFAEMVNAPIITTQRGKAWANPYHPLARGVFGFAGHASARQTLSAEAVGLILAVGTTLWEWSTASWDSVLLNKKLVYIHPAPTYFGQAPLACLNLSGTVRETFSWLNTRLAKHLTPANFQLPIQNPCFPAHITLRHPETCQSAAEPIKPQRLLCELMQRLPAETRYYIDNSNSVPWSIHYLFSAWPGAYRPALGFAPMGWAIGAAVGSALAAPTIPVVCLTGDGCFLMSGSEITVAVAEALPVIFVVANDHAYGMIKHSHRLIGKEAVSYAIPHVDFCQLAHSLGANAYLIQHIEDFSKIEFSTLLKSSKPTLLEVLIDTEEMPPLGMF